MNVHIFITDKIFVGNKFHTCDFSLIYFPFQSSILYQRTWSSYNNICTKHGAMNDVEDRHPSSVYCSPTLLRKPATNSFDYLEQSQKKDKKWSLGSLFRRKKKEGSASSTEDETDKRGFLNRRRKKGDKRKKQNRQRTTFDHIVVPDKVNKLFNSHPACDDVGILSDPTGGFGSYTGRALPKVPKVTGRNGTVTMGPRDANVDALKSSMSSSESLTRKSRKELTKMRAKVRRESNIRCDSSSDDDSQRSASSSRFRSDESIGRARDVSANRRSRTSRTERYLQRHSKEEDVILTREPNLHKSRSDVENLQSYLKSYSRRDTTNLDGKNHPALDFLRDTGRNEKNVNVAQDISNSKLRAKNDANAQRNSSGLSTIPPSHNVHHKNNVENVQKRQDVSNVRSNRYNSLNVDEPRDSSLNYQRSVSYDADINRTATPTSPIEILHVRYPLGKPNLRYRNLSLVEQSQMVHRKQPPPPPPRDPWRLVTVQNLEHGRPLSYCFERTGNFAVPTSEAPKKKRNSEIKPHSFNWHPSYRSTSEDQLTGERSPIPLQPPRPSSVTSEVSVVQKPAGASSRNATENYEYFTDRNPRSRKPIIIQSTAKDFANSDEHQANVKNALEFWKQKDLEELNHVHERGKKSVPTSPQMFTAQTHVTTKVFLPSVVVSDLESVSGKDDAKRTPSPFKPISPNPTTFSYSRSSSKGDDSKRVSVDSITDEMVKSGQDCKRKSSNLEDALDELEAIYKSLHLGDEDLLERAEHREMVTAKKILDSKMERYPDTLTTTMGSMSDSGFNYEPFDSVESPKRKRTLKRCPSIDRKSDDMAYRKLHKEQPVLSNSNATSSVSYLLASPVFGNSANEGDCSQSNASKEPNVTLDDVVYRNIKHANNTLKVVEPQPPFGIPIGPILQAPNSDYLHAIPDNTLQNASPKSKPIPDVVKDDLAFRNLRKDVTKEQPLSSILGHEDNNNNGSLDNHRPFLNSLKKKRAIRSLSANIYNLVHNQSYSTPRFEDNSLEVQEKSKLTDIADAMQIARQILKEKEEKINATRRAFLSDTEAKYKKYSSRNEAKSNPEKRANQPHSSDTDTKHKNNVDKLETNLPRNKCENSPQSKVQVNMRKYESVTHWRPPRYSSQRSVRESTPVAVSNLEASEEYLKSSLEDLLTAFAVEANETSKLISDELLALENNITSEKVERHTTLAQFEPELVEKPSDSDDNVKLIVTNNDVETQHDDTSESVSCQEHDNENEEVSAAEVTTSLPLEEVAHITTPPYQLANMMISASSDLKSQSPVELHSDSEHDYVNVGSDVDVKIQNVGGSSEKSEFPREEHDVKLTDVEELNQAQSQGVPEKTQEDDELERFPPRDVPSEFPNPNSDVVGEDGGELCGGLTCDALPLECSPECAFLSRFCVNLSESGKIVSHVSNCDIKVGKHSDQSFPDENHVESATVQSKSRNERGYRNPSSCSSDKRIGLNQLETLESPKLVLESNLKLNETNFDRKQKRVDDVRSHREQERGGVQTSSESLQVDGAGSQAFKSNAQMPGFERRCTFDTQLPTSTCWYNNPMALAFACSYGFACTYQVANLDIVTILGLLFVFISFAAALMY